MNPQAEAIQSAIEKLEALKAKCMPVTCRTLEDQADSALAAIDVCRRFHEIQSDCLIQLAAIAADAGNSALTKNGIKLLMSRDDVNDVLYDAEQWAKKHAGDGTYSPRMHGTYSTLRGSVN